MIAAQKEAESYGTLPTGHMPSAARRCSRTSTRTCRRTCAASASKLGSLTMAHDDDDPGAPLGDGRDARARRQRRGVRRGRRLLRRRVPLHRRPAGEVRHARACSTRRSPRAASSAPPSAWPPTACARWSRSSSPTTSIRRYDQIVSEAARLRYRSAGDFTAPIDDPHALRRRHLRRADAQPEPGGAVHARLRPAHGDAVATPTTPRAC